MVKAFEKQTKTIEDQGEKEVKAIQDKSIENIKKCSDYDNDYKKELFIAKVEVINGIPKERYISPKERQKIIDIR